MAVTYEKVNRPDVSSSFLFVLHDGLLCKARRRQFLRDEIDMSFPASRPQAPARLPLARASLRGRSDPSIFIL